MILYTAAGATRYEQSSKSIAAKLRARVCDTKGFQYAFVKTSHPATRYIYTNTMNGKRMTILDPATQLWKKKGDVKHYKGEPIVNILVEL